VTSTDGNGRHRLHAARVATAATAIVVTCYALCAVGLSMFVAHRLLSQADARIAPVLAEAPRLHLGSSGAPSTAPQAGPQSAAPAQNDAGNGDLDDAPVFLWRVASGGSVRPLTVGAPALPRRRWDGAPVTVSVGASPFRLDSRRVGSGWLVAGQSVADVTRVRAALVLPELLFGVLLAVVTFVGSLLVGLRASAPLALVRRRQAEFTADASHELRTPLSVVEAEVDLALRRPRPPEEYEAVLRRIAGESKRLRRIVDDLLWLARADSGSDQAVPAARTDVGAVVRACVERFQPVAERLGVALVFEPDGESGTGPPAPAHQPTVQASHELVDRLGGVLIDNACKYAGQGGTAVVSVRASGSRVALRVDDSGPGIPQDQRTAVFDRFHRVTDRGGGAGLGLAIADSVVRLTAGSWNVAESPLGGARMEVSWRRAPGDPPPATGTDAVRPRAGSGGRRGTGPPADGAAGTRGAGARGDGGDGRPPVDDPLRISSPS
jgi:signal transduction histidine kinase